MRSILISTLILLALMPGQAQPPYSLRQYLSIRGAVDAAISPDGKEVLFRTSITGTAQVWKVSDRGGWPDQLTFFPSGVASATWSPKGDGFLAVVDQDGNEQFQFYWIKSDGTQTIPLTDNPKVRHSLGGWSHDGKSIFYTSNARDPRFFDCYLLDMQSRQARLVFQKNAVLDASALSRDGRLLAVEEAVSPVDSNIYLVEVATGAARLLTPHTGDAEYSVIDFSPDGKSLYVITNAGRDFKNLAAIDVATGALNYLHREEFDVEAGRLSPDGKRLAFIMNRDGYQQLGLWELPSLRPVRLPGLPQGIIAPGNFTRDGQRLALSINTPTRNTDAWVLDVAARRVWPVTRSTLAGIDPDTFVEPTLIRYSSEDGRQIPAFFYLPKNAKNDMSLPVILSVHGGPEGQERPYFNPLYQYFISRGYAVLAPNIRGSSGYGKSYLAADNGPKRWDALKDLNAAVDWIAMQPQLNPRKVAIMGGSYGGFAVLAMLAHYPSRFAAGVDMFGIADFKTFLANTAPFRRPLRIAEYGDPEKDSEFMDAISPARNVHKIAAPLLVIQGANDPRVPESESAQIVQKVKARGGIVEYLLFPDEGHGIAKLANRIRCYEAVVDFLDRYVRLTTRSAK